MKIRFQADADLNEDIVSGILRRAPEIDFKTASEASLAGIKDEMVLTIAANENRVLVTHDRKTMPRHFAEFIDGNDSSGVFVISQHAPIATVIDDLILIWHIAEPEEFVNNIRTLPL